MSDTIQIQKGSILIYRVFDIAEEIHLSKVEKIVSQLPSSRLKLTRPLRHAIVIRNAPIRIALGELDIPIGKHKFKGECSVTLWDYGVLSVLFQIPIAPGTPWTDLLKLSAFITGDDPSDEAIEDLARAKCLEIATVIAPALNKPSEWDVYEDYTVYFFEKFSGNTTVKDMIERGDLPILILGEPDEPLAEDSRAPILENMFQYSTNDLAVIDWNSAVVIEPNGQRDIPDVLEFALTHLLEVRYYDDLLDQRLNELYDAIELKHRSSILGSRFLKLSHEANSRFIEFSEVIERVDNSLKVVGDFYLAKIFRAVTRRFRLPDWEQSITRKMDLLARVSQLLQGEVNVQRSFLLEVVIIFLIAFEVASALLKPLMKM